jgi:starvation-inducible outer membrane lipoprotein
MSPYHISPQGIRFLLFGLLLLAACSAAPEALPAPAPTSQPDLSLVVFYSPL